MFRTSRLDIAILALFAVLGILVYVQAGVLGVLVLVAVAAALIGCTVALIRTASTPRQH